MANFALRQFDKGNDMLKGVKLLKGDFAVIAVVLLAAAALLAGSFNGKENAAAFAVSCDGRENSFLIEQDGEYTVVSNGIELKIKVSDGKIRVAEAGCPDQICVKSGDISETGEMIVCFPARVIIEAVGGRNKEDEIDGVAG